MTIKFTKEWCQHMAQLEEDSSASFDVGGQPEALRIAAALEYCDASVARQAINELRRLHAENAAQAQQIAQDRADAALGRIAIKFVDRAGDVHPGIDDAEKICAEFYEAMCEQVFKEITAAAMKEKTP